MGLSRHITWYAHRDYVRTVGTQVLNAGVYRSVIKLDYNPRQLGLSPLKAVEADLLSLCIQE